MGGDNNLESRACRRSGVSTAYSAYEYRDAQTGFEPILSRQLYLWRVWARRRAHRVQHVKEDLLVLRLDGAVCDAVALDRRQALHEEDALLVRQCHCRGDAEMAGVTMVSSSGCK